MAAPDLASTITSTYNVAEGEPTIALGRGV
jgi:hypothetical protein